MPPRTTRAAAADAKTSSPKRLKVSSTRHVDVADTEAEKKTNGKAHSAQSAHTWVKLKQASPSESGEVFVCGGGDCGQLGLGPDVTEAKNLKKLAYFDDKDIVAIAAGGLHSLVLSKDGKVYSWGCNDQMVLGRGGEETEPGPVEGLDGVKIVQIACGDSVSVALSEDGQVYAWGTFRNKNGIFGFRPDVDIQPRPFLIPELSKVILITTGADHVVALTIDRKIFTWGCGESGQLARKVMARYEKQQSLIPRQIAFKPSKRYLLTPEIPYKAPQETGTTVTKTDSQIVSAHCGGLATFLIHETGTVFAVGLNNHGQLGVGDTDEYDSLTPFGDLVDNMDKERDVSHVGFKDVVGSEHHTIALDRAGRIYTFGRNDDGQLGIGEKTSVSTPHLLAEPKNVLEISANGTFTLAVTQDTDFEGNNLWMWGFGEMGQLANGGEDEDTPAQVRLKNRHVYHAVCGGQHTLLLLRPKDA